FERPGRQGPERDFRMDEPRSPTLQRPRLRHYRHSRRRPGRPNIAGNSSPGSVAMTPVKGGYAVDVPVINVSERARREHASVVSTFHAFAVTLRRLFTSLFKGDIPTINYPEQTRPYSERFRGTHILTVRNDGSLK